jgi:hypothetical protein
MTVLQSSYSERMQPAAVGAPAEPDWEAHSRIVETAAGIGFGLAVGRGTSERGVVLGGAVFAGISLRDITQPPDNVDEYSQNDNIGVMVRGTIWVLAAADVFASDLVHYNETTGALSNAGGTLIAGATWESDAASGALGKVRLGGALPSSAAGT